MAETYVSWLSIGLSTCFYSYQIIPFYNALRGKLNYELTPIMLVSTLYMDCLTWWIYGNKMNCNPIIYANCIGGCILLTLILIYLGLEVRKYFLDTVLNLIILILGSMVIYKGLTLVLVEPDKNGLIAIGTKVITFISPSYIIYKVIREKNPNLIILPLVIINFVSCIIWFIFAGMINNEHLKWANCIGILFSIIQVMTFFVYKNIIIGNLNNSTIEIEASSDDNKKEAVSPMNFDEEKEEKVKEKPVKIITKMEN